MLYYIFVHTTVQQTNSAPLPNRTPKILLFHVYGFLWQVVKVYSHPIQQYIMHKHS